MQTRLDQHIGTGTSCNVGPLRPGSSNRVTSAIRRPSGKASGPLPLYRTKPWLSSQSAPLETQRDVSCDAHCAIPWEIAEKSLVDPAGKDACGVSYPAQCCLPQMSLLTAVTETAQADACRV